MEECKKLRGLLKIKNILIFSHELKRVFPLIKGFRVIPGIQNRMNNELIIVLEEANFVIDQMIVITDSENQLIETISLKIDINNVFKKPKTRILEGVLDLLSNQILERLTTRIKKTHPSEANTSKVLTKFGYLTYYIEYLKEKQNQMNLNRFKNCMEFFESLIRIFQNFENFSHFQPQFNEKFFFVTKITLGEIQFEYSNLISKDLSNIKCFISSYGVIKKKIREISRSLNVENHTGLIEETEKEMIKDAIAAYSRNVEKDVNPSTTLNKLELLKEILGSHKQFICDVVNILRPSTLDILQRYLLSYYEKLKSNFFVSFKEQSRAEKKLVIL